MCVGTGTSFAQHINKVRRRQRTKHVLVLFRLSAFKHNCHVARIIARADGSLTDQVRQPILYR